MIRRIIQFCGMSWREQLLVMEAFCLTGIVRLAILWLPFRWLALALGKHMQESPPEVNMAEALVAKRIGWGVATVSRYTPWESKCLVQGIVGKIMLRQFGIANTLYLGVNKNGENLVAHAWLRCGAMIITGDKGYERFKVISKFADKGSSLHKQEKGVIVMKKLRWSEPRLIEIEVKLTAKAGTGEDAMTAATGIHGSCEC